MIATPLLALLLTMLALGRLTWRMFDRNMAVLTCLVLMLLPLIIMQYKPMRVDHHSWQILTVAVAIWGLSWRKAAHGGTIAGLAMAFGLMISLEVIFIAAGLGLILALRWLRDQNARWWLVSYLQSLALGLVVFFAATRGLPDLATHCDVMSPPQIGLFLIVALGAGALAVPSAIPGSSAELRPRVRSPSKRRFPDQSVPGRCRPGRRPAAGRSRPADRRSAESVP